MKQIEATFPVVKPSLIGVGEDWLVISSSMESFPPEGAESGRNE